jgi:transcriptional regulator with XRE-family HTH domain
MKTAENYKCYRLFLSDYLESHQFTYRAFAKKYGNYISFPLLAKILRKTSSGEFSEESNIRLEKLAALLTALGVDRKGVTHLILSQIERDSQPGSYKHSSALSEILKSLRSESINNSYMKYFEALDCLLPNRRNSVINELREQLAIEIERSGSLLKTRKMKLLLEAL